MGKIPGKAANTAVIGVAANKSALNKRLSLKVTADASISAAGHGATWQASQQQARRMPAQHTAGEYALLLHSVQSALAM